MSAKDEVKDIFLKKFGPASASLLDTIKAGSDAEFVKGSFDLLAQKVGPTVAKSFMENVLKKYA